MEMQTETFPMHSGRQIFQAGCWGDGFCQAQSQLQLNLIRLRLALFSVYPATHPAGHPPTQNSTEIHSCKLTGNRHNKIKQSTKMEDNLHVRIPH